MPPRGLSGAPFVLLLSFAAVAAPRQSWTRASAQPPQSGLDLARFDTSVRPQDDLFQFVNGGWLNDTAIPSDRVSYGALMEVSERVERDLQSVIDELTASPRRSRVEQQIVDLYASMTGTARLEELGTRPIDSELRRIDAVATATELAAEAGHLSAIAAGGPFDGSIGLDTRNPQMPIVQVFQGGTLLPDRDYYLKPDTAFAEIRKQYEAYLTTIFMMTGRRDPATDARAVLALETALAAAQWTQAESVDRVRTNNSFALADLPVSMPGFDWMAWARPQGIDRTPNVVLAQPSFFKSFAALVPATPLSTWKAWLSARYITASAPYLTQAFNDARFDFFGRILTGQEAPRERWRRGVGLVSQFLGDAIGRLYIERRFPPTAKARAHTLVDNVMKACRQAIGDSDWMSAPTRREALVKLSNVTARMAYPDRWRTYGGFVVKRDDLLGNVQRGQKFESDDRMEHLRQPPDPGRWTMTPQTVNAYYSLALNEVVVPAAMLQPPLFALDADAAVNYGAIGAIVGHELTHGFDQRGRKWTTDGRVRDWWKPQDGHAFEERERGLNAQFHAFSPLPGVHVNGELTLAENIGDLGGLALAYRAYRISLGGQRSAVIDGFTGEQRFFLSWARMWRAKMRDEFLRQYLLSTPYAPPQYRANGIVSNVQGFYEAFGVTPGDRLYRDPKSRVRIW